MGALDPTVKIIVSTFYYPNYDPLAEYTVKENLSGYCLRHRYELIPYRLDEPIDPDPYKMACRACFKNTELILDTLEKRPDAEYVFHRDCDSIITDMNRKLEDFALLYPFDIVIGSDKAGLNAGQMLVKNTEQARKYLREFLDHKSKYEHEQDYMAKNPKPFLHVVPQRVMNSYDTESRLEQFDPMASWQEGDFLVHLAGLNLGQKMKVVQKWLGKVEFNG